MWLMTATITWSKALYLIVITFAYPVSSVLYHPCEQYGWVSQQCCRSYHHSRNHQVFSCLVVHIQSQFHSYKFLPSNKSKNQTTAGFRSVKSNEKCPATLRRALNTVIANGRKSGYWSNAERLPFDAVKA
jgi:hypothetical protein